MREHKHSFHPPPGYNDLFGPPALRPRSGVTRRRRERLERASLAMLDGRDKAYLEVRDVLDAFPEATSDVLEAIADHERAAARGADR